MLSIPAVGLDTSIKLVQMAASAVSYIYSKLPAPTMLGYFPVLKDGARVVFFGPVSPRFTEKVIRPYLTKQYALNSGFYTRWMYAPLEYPKVTSFPPKTAVHSTIIIFDQLLVPVLSKHADALSLSWLMRKHKAAEMYVNIFAGTNTWSCPGCLETRTEKGVIYSSAFGGGHHYQLTAPCVVCGVKARLSTHGLEQF
jgi:hypothetical protein